MANWIESIVDLMRKGPELSSEFDAVKINTKSVARGANDAVLQFPLIAPDTIPYDLDMVMMRVMERVYAAFTQTWLSLHPVIDISIDKNPIQFLKRFHQNVKWESVKTRMLDEEEYDTLLERVINKDYNLYLSQDKSYGVFFSATDSIGSAFLESFTEGMKPYLSDFDIDTSVFYEAPEDTGSIADSFVQGAIHKGRLQEISMTGQNKPTTGASMISQLDVKKANDMLPYAIEVKLMGVNKNKEFVQWFQFVVGVKTVLHVVKSDEMVANITNVLQNRSFVNKMLRWTSGEISLWKNIILDLDNLKYDAIARADKRSPFFGTLKRLKSKKLGFHNGTVPHGIIPNSTIVVSEYEIDMVKNSVGVDLHDVKIARALMRKLFLMTFMIVDNGSGIIDVLYDGATEFQSYTMETLERELQSDTNKNNLRKEIGRMVTGMG